MIGLHPMSRSLAYGRAHAAWLFALALACAPVVPALAEESAPSPAAAERAPESAAESLTPGPPSSRFT